MTQHFIDPLHMFDIQSPIGFGGFGEILKASGADGKEYVVKKIPKSMKQANNIDREVKAGLKLSHKTIVNYTTRFRDDENDYLVFEYLKGNSREFLEFYSI